ncbi:hypothetical protein HIEAAJJG_01060 [Streptococcus equi subsp. zooepidemicus]|nr:hypothetical protein HIEAAJJG_01060 [Streptococcus equi subsp. zooepidemicus]
MSQKEVGHQFLARLGKKRLRPGGVEATNWLVQQGEFSSDCQLNGGGLQPLHDLH